MCSTVNLVAVEHEDFFDLKLPRHFVTKELCCPFGGRPLSLMLESNLGVGLRFVRGMASAFGRYLHEPRF